MVRCRRREWMRLILFPQTVPKSLGSVSIPLWKPHFLESHPSVAAHHTRIWRVRESAPGPPMMEG